MKKLLFLAVILLSLSASAGNPIAGLMERISPGLSQKITVEICPADTDYFTLTQRPAGPHIEASNPISAAVGLNRYMKYVACQPLTWDKMTATLPATLPAVVDTISQQCPLPYRYYLNYCTHSYSMAFWDWQRWQQEIDWMALQGINIPLAITGSELLWERTLRRMGYPEEKISGFIAGAGFQAWWLMNNLEGWGGPACRERIDGQAALQQRILRRMRDYGMEPVLPGYCGMLPHDAESTLGVKVINQGLWCGYPRPSILLPTDSAYTRFASIYYEELERLYGKARYFSTDPFHEGGATGGSDLHAAGRAVVDAMKRHNPQAVWIAQGWQENPRTEILEAVNKGDIIVLDLKAEVHPMWCTRLGGFLGHEWIMCQLLNFGGNTGIYGTISSLVDGFDRARHESATLRGIGLTPEGIENNSMMYELMCELPWLDSKPDISKWVSDYARTRYGGVKSAATDSAWQILAASIYNCPPDSAGEGTRESLFCARPGRNIRNASTWARAHDYYQPAATTYRAAELMRLDAPIHAGNAHFLYDYIDVVRQAIADRGREQLKRVDAARTLGKKEAYRLEADMFLHLILLQDSLLSLHPSFCLDTFIREARNNGYTPADADLNEYNLRVQITTWGNRNASEAGKLHDYSNREWSGLLRDFYHPRWKLYFDHELANWDNPSATPIDFYPIEEQWTLQRGVTPAPIHTIISPLEAIGEYLRHSY